MNMTKEGAGLLAAIHATLDDARDVRAENKRLRRLLNNVLYFLDTENTEHPEFDIAKQEARAAMEGKE